VLIEFDSTFLKRHDDAGAAELEDADLVAFVDPVAWLLPFRVDSIGGGKLVGWGGGGDKGGDLLNRTDIRRSDGDKHYISKLLTPDTNPASRIPSQDVDVGTQGNRIDLVIVSVDLLPAHDGPGNGRVVAVVVLRRETKAGHGAVGESLGEFVVGEEVGHGEVLALDPDSVEFGHGRVDDEAGVCDDDGYCLLMWS
ncbi:MAG: hypothetical protein Q9187_005706, partial [Circinaria calcarea]